MPFTVKLAVITAAVLLYLPSAGPAVAAPADSPEQRVATASAGFGSDLFREITSDDNLRDNTIISPASLMSALTMTLHGAGGETREEMARVLHLESFTEDQITSGFAILNSIGDRDPAVNLTTANSLWHREGYRVRPEFAELARAGFGASLQGLDFASPEAAGTINAWVESATNGRIGSMVEGPIDSETLMFLINAVCFDASWTVAFDPGRTETRPFHLANGSTSTCRMMHSDTTYDYFENDLFQAVRLPYGNGAFDMIVVLPRPSHTVGEVLPAFTAPEESGWQDDFRASLVRLGLPKYDGVFEDTLNAALQALGMRRAFGHEADFRNMFVTGGALIDMVIHRVMVRIDENGTEAAAASAVRMTKGPAIPSMVVDRPFIFMIRETENGLPLFMGVINDPQEREQQG